MMRCLIDVGQWSAEEIELAPDEAHHLLKVLRARPGERVGLFTGHGHTAEATLETIRPKRARLRLKPETRRKTLPPVVAVTLIQATPKHTLMDSIIQKATELGAQTIQPTITERVIVRLSASAQAQRRERWQKIALEATRQCGRAWIPTVLPVRSLPEITADLARYDVCLVASLQAEAQMFREVIDRLRPKIYHPVGAPTRLALVIGPEGDLTTEETRKLQAAGAHLVRFSTAVLRVETAAFYGLSLLDYEIAD
ncbi:MAG: 16S rRNA (uracil(1498)-N(3))-methyltransferase [Lentisphaerae bacterium]|nr:16S rRNA (uracil(1498)-N(3))-methyltransferase [Lentisphaerota bacterium]